jgi:acyl carrier protein
VLDRVNSDRLSLAADRITALVRAILEKRAVARAVGLNDDLGACGISSLDMVNLMLAVEAEFDLKIPDRDMTPSNFRTVARIQALVEKLQRAA